MEERRQEIDIDLRQILQTVRKRALLIISVVIAITTLSGIISHYFLDKIYEASAKLIVTKKAEVGDIQYNDVILNQRLVKTYSEIAKSRTIAEQVINNLSLDITILEFGKKIKISSVSDTEVILIKVEDKNAELAAIITNELSRVFVMNIVNLIRLDNIQVLDYAVVPESHTKPKVAFNIAIAFILGMFLSLGIVLVLDYLDNTIKDANDIEKYLGLPVLASIPVEIE